MYGLSTGADWAMSKGVPVFCALGFVMGSITLLDANAGLQSAPLSTETTLMVESGGAILAGGAAMMYAHATGVAATKAIGYGFVPFIVSLVKNLKKFENTGMDTKPFMLWIAMAAVIVGTLSL